MSILTIISHTEHYQKANGDIVGLGSTVTEVNNLLEIFDEIIHVAMFHNGLPPASSLPYVSNKIKFIPLPALGGSKITDKLNIIWKAPSILKTIKSALKQSDYFQFRAPTGIGVYVIPYLILFSSKKGWFKYAGNWKQEHPPITYKFQRWLLKTQKRKITINGAWQNQKSQCLTFENPCLTLEEIEKGLEIIRNKDLKNSKFNFCFVGRLEEEKGIDVFIKAFNNLSLAKKSQIDSIHVVGDGQEKEVYKNLALKSDLNFIFHGYLSRQDVHEVYKKSNAIVLPSASEGFPKVIAEAMCFGCLPIVSNVSSIGHYVKDEINGFLLDPITTENVTINIEKVINLTNIQYFEMIKTSKTNLLKFTYSYYNKRIKCNILSI